MFLELEHVRIHFRYQKWKYSPFLEKALRLPKIRNHLRGRKHYPSHPWNWYIYRHEWLVFMGNIASKPYIYPTVGVVYLHEWLDASLYLPTFGWGKSNKNHPNLGSDPNVKAVGLQARPGPWQFGLPRPKDATSKVVEETSGRALVLWNCPSTWEDETPRIWNKW